MHVEHLWRTRLRKISHRGIPDFWRDLVLPDVYNRSKFEYCAFSGLKADRLKKKKKKKQQEK